VAEYYSNQGMNKKARLWMPGFLIEVF